MISSFSLSSFISGCAGFSLLAGCSLAVALCGYGAPASHCGGFPSCRAQALRRAGFRSCGAWAQ